MAKRLFVFIDESGDCGDNDGTGHNSIYYAEVAFQIVENGIPALRNHMAYWRYTQGIHGEFSRLPKNKDLERYLRPIYELYNMGVICISAVYINKPKYTGPYLKASSPRGQNPIRFRNFIHRQLLEYHFATYQPNDEKIEIVFDRFDMTRGDIDDLTDYLEKNLNLPVFEHICHVDSLYIEPIQFVSQLVNRIGDIALKRCKPEDEKLIRKIIAIKDITNI